MPYLRRTTSRKKWLGSPGNDSLTGNNQANTIYGNGGTDTLSGGSGNATFVLGATQQAAASQIQREAIKATCFVRQPLHNKTISRDSG